MHTLQMKIWGKTILSTPQTSYLNLWVKIHKTHTLYVFYENKKVLTLGSKEPISLELLMQIIKKFTNSNSKIVANYLGRSPYTIDESAWQGKEDYLKDTKSSLLLFLKDYLGNFSYNIPNK